MRRWARARRGGRESLEEVETMGSPHVPGLAHPGYPGQQQARWVAEAEMVVEEDGGGEVEVEAQE